MLRSIVIEIWNRSYVIEQGICYLALAHKAYPKRLAFIFLEEIARDFESELRADHGDEWLRQVETVGRQYAFIKFGNIDADFNSILFTVLAFYLILFRI